MPPASVSLLFTWSVESVLLGLTGLALFGWTWPILSQLVLASVTATAHLLLAARQQDEHHEVSVSYLCVITGLTAVHALRPLSSLGEIMGLCFFAVSELAALGMTFASCEGTTTLFLHPRGLGAVLIAIALDTACWNKVIGLVVGLVLAAVLAVPSWLTAILVTMAAGALLICYTIIVADWARLGVAAFVVGVCMAWGWLHKAEHETMEEIPVAAAPPQMYPGRQMVWPRMARPVFKDL